jgi:hypothetical protein
MKPNIVWRIQLHTHSYVHGWVPGRSWKNCKIPIFQWVMWGWAYTRSRPILEYIQYIHCVVHLDVWCVSAYII